MDGAGDIDWAFDDEQNDNGVEENGCGDHDCVMDDLQRHAEGRRILTLTDLEHQYLVVRARLRLAQVSWEQGMLRVGATSLPDLYAALIATGLYEVSLSCSVWNVFALVFLRSINS